MFRFFRLWLGVLAGCFRSHRTLLLENLALRQELTVLKRRHPKPKLSPLDKLFWVSARRFWSAWKSSLIIVTPETVVRWHRARFRRYWSLIPRVKERVGRKKLSQEIRDLIFQMVTDNSTWGTPRIHGELLMLGFDVSERSISRWMKRAPPGSRTCPALAGLSSQSSRSDRRHGFFHCPDGHLQPAVLLLYY
jgi:putative transposase